MSESKDAGINVEELYTRYGPMVLRRCRRLLGDEEKAKDAMQEVFIKMLLNQQRLHDDFPSSLLYRMATNMCLNIIRADRIRQTENEEDILTQIASYDEHEDKLMWSNLLDTIFKTEKASTREIAVMVYVDGMSLQETADAVGLSMSGIRKRLRLLKERVHSLKEINYEK